MSYYMFTKENAAIAAQKLAESENGSTDSIISGKTDETIPVHISLSGSGTITITCTYETCGYPELVMRNTSPEYSQALSPEILDAIRVQMESAVMDNPKSLKFAEVVHADEAGYADAIEKTVAKICESINVFERQADRLIESAIYSVQNKYTE